MNFEPGQIVEHAKDFQQRHMQRAPAYAKNKYIVLGTIAARNFGRTGDKTPRRLKLYCCEGHPDYVGGIVSYPLNILQLVSE